MKLLHVMVASLFIFIAAGYDIKSSTKLRGQKFLQRSSAAALDMWPGGDQQGYIGLEEESSEDDVQRIATELIAKNWVENTQCSLTGNVSTEPDGLQEVIEGCLSCGCCHHIEALRERKGITTYAACKHGYHGNPVTGKGITTSTVPFPGVNFRVNSWVTGKQCSPADHLLAYSDSLKAMIKKCHATKVCHHIMVDLASSVYKACQSGNNGWHDLVDDHVDQDTRAAPFPGMALAAWKAASSPKQVSRSSDRAAWDPYQSF